MHAALAYQASPLPCPACVSLQTFMQRRRAVLLSDSYWAEAIPRIDIYIWIMQVRACSLCLQPVACGLLPSLGELSRHSRRAQHWSLHST